jgi:hypothetical protein
VPPRNLLQRIDFGRHAEGVNHQDGARARRNRPLHAVRIKIQSDGIDFGEDRRSTHLKHRIGNGHKGERGNDDLVAFAHPQHQQCEMQTGCT